MTDRLTIGFTNLTAAAKGTVFVLAGPDLALGPQASTWSGLIEKAAQVKSFTGERGSSLELLTPAGAEAIDQLVVVGLGKLDEMTEEDWTKLGGDISSLLPKVGEATVILERPDDTPINAEQCAAVALGLRLRAYSFDKYKTLEKPKKSKKRSVGFAVADPQAAKKIWASYKAVAEGVELARDLVNEPANHLGPVEFAGRLSELEALGVEVTVLDEKALRKHKMGALLGVSQGSDRPPRLVSLVWSGGRSKDRPIAFVGKGVVFDTGGISIKPAAGMEDMKGDMGGAAAVSGLFHALASRKAKANVVGVVGLVENMPDGKAQRPGDIVTSMSGQTIEVINTDAEGRLVLADALTYVQETFKPTAIVDLATLTGAIIVALGHYYAGMFSSDDTLADRLTRAGESVGDKVWRMPIGPEYDKLIDSKNADMKNVGGRWGGAVAAAQFIKRFVKDDTPWAHIDLAGTAMGSPSTSINASWGSGYGVRLLDRLVRDSYEK